MIEDQQSQEEALFDLAVQMSSAAERATFLDGACRDNPALRARIGGLLEGHFGAAKFLTKSAIRPAPANVGTQARGAAPLSALSPAGSRADEGPAQMIGRYQLLEKIGEGGFGEVWMAEQREPVKRRVAVKIIKLGMDTKSVVARFEAERQALATMDHPNIAKVLDAGATESGRPFFVMELVSGLKLNEYCYLNDLSLRQRLELFMLVCHAVQHAHQKGIVHRDLKPSNILVTEHEGAAAPKVIDFGIAKATEQGLDERGLTSKDQFLGTPAYMSPEQLQFGGRDIDTRSDIYSLGVILYELLTGHPPFDPRELARAGVEEMRRIIREVDPPRPSTTILKCPSGQLPIAYRPSRERLAAVRGDLDWIVMKCLEKERDRRYETANGLAMDIRRHLANEPVVARRPTAIYRLKKTVRRNQVAFIASTLVFLVLVIGVSAVILVQHRANQDYRQRLYVSEINRAGTAWQAGQPSQMLALLDRCPADLRHWEWQFLHQQAQRWDVSVFLAGTNFAEAELSADRRLVAVAAGEVIQIRDFPTGQWRLNIPFRVEWHSRFSVSPGDESLATFTVEGKITVWNMHTGDRLVEMNHGGPTRVLEWSADGQRLVSAGNDGVIRIWDAKTGRAERTLSKTGTVFAVAFSPDGKTLAVGTGGNKAELLDLSTSAVKRTVRAKGDSIRLLKFSPDGRKLAISSAHTDDTPRDTRVWSLEEDGSLDISTGTSAVSFDFSPDGRQLCFADPTGMIRLWDLDQQVEIERVSAQALSARLLPDGRIFSAGRDGKIRIWQAQRSRVQQLKGYSRALRTLTFSPDGRWLVSAGLDSKVFVWNAQGGLAGVYTNHGDGAYAAAFSPDGRVATTGFERKVHVWDPASRVTLWAKPLAPADDAYWLVYAPDGRRLYVASHTDTISVLDAASGERLNSLRGFENVLDGLAISPDSQLLAICHKVKLSVWLADGSRQLWQAPANPERCAAFSPDGKWIATGDQDGKVSLWEVAASGRVRRTLSGHAAAVTGVSFHPDGRRLVSSSFDGQVKVWDWQAGFDLLTLPLPGGGMAWHVIFSPDGKTIAAAGGDGIVTLWKTE